MTDIDTVAEAIWRADHEGTVDVRGLEWEKSVYRDLYRRMAQAAIDALQLTQERELLHHETFGDFVDGIQVSSRNGTNAYVNCHLCEKSEAGFSPRGAFDWAYKHALDVHGIVPKYRTRLVSPWVRVEEQP